MYLSLHDDKYFISHSTGPLIRTQLFYLHSSMNESTNTCTNHLTICQNSQKILSWILICCWEQFTGFYANYPITITQFVSTFCISGNTCKQNPHPLYNNYIPQKNKYDYIIINIFSELRRCQFNSAPRIFLNIIF